MERAEEPARPGQLVELALQRIEVTSTAPRSEEESRVLETAKLLRVRQDAAHGAGALLQLEGEVKSLSGEVTGRWSLPFRKVGEK